MFRVDAAVGNRKLLIDLSQYGVDPSEWDDCYQTGEYKWEWCASPMLCFALYLQNFCFTPQPAFSAASSCSGEILAFSMCACCWLHPVTLCPAYIEMVLTVQHKDNRRRWGPPCW